MASRTSKSRRELSAAHEHALDDIFGHPGWSGSDSLDLSEVGEDATKATEKVTHDHTDATLDGIRMSPIPEEGDFPGLSKGAILWDIDTLRPLHVDDLEYESVMRFTEFGEEVDTGGILVRIIASPLDFRSSPEKGLEFVNISRLEPEPKKPTISFSIKKGKMGERYVPIDPMGKPLFPEHQDTFYNSQERFRAQIIREIEANKHKDVPVTDNDLASTW